MYSTKSTFLAGVLLIGINICAQPKKLNEEKWIKAIVNLDTRESGQNQMSLLWRDLIEKRIDHQTYEKKSQEIYSKLNRYFGSALYFTYNGREYLLTARHVLEDTTDEVSNYHERIFNKFFLVDNFQDYMNKKNGNPRTRTMVMNIKSGPSNMAPYAFSKICDLAIVSLNALATRDLRHTLKDRKYLPIDFSDIDTACNIKPGDEIFSVGYTADLTELASKEISSASINWESEKVTVPIFSKGTVDDVFTKNYFAGNIFVFHGNSGGPIISNNKLVGIVSHGNYIQKNADGFLYFRRLIFMVKSSEILPLLKEVEQKIIMSER